MDLNKNQQVTENTLIPFYWDESRLPKMDLLNIRLLSSWDLDLDNLEENMLMKLLGVAQHNQLEWLKNGIHGNIPLNLIHNEGHTVLTIATQFGSREVAEYLIDLGLNPAFYAEKGMQYNAYFSACAGGQFAMIDFLLNHPSGKITIEMAEPRHLQSGLQIAIHNLQFACALKMIEKYPELLMRLDKLHRTALGTLLSIFATSTFNDYIAGKGMESQLEEFGLALLNYENPFKQISAEALPAIQILLHPAYASFHQVAAFQVMKPIDAVRTVHLACPKLGKVLFEHAQKNPKGKLEQFFKMHSEKHFADEELVKNHEKNK